MVDLAKSLGCSVDFASEVCHADCSGCVGHQRREQCEDFVADPLQTITAIVRSKWSVLQDCAAGYRERVPTSFTHLRIKECIGGLDIHWW